MLTSLEQQLNKRRSRFPKFYKSDLAKPFHSLLAHVEQDFCDKRSSIHLARIITTHYYFRKQLSRAIPIHQILFKCFFSKFQERKVLSLTFAVHLSHLAEVPEEKHISRALSHFLPGTKIVSESFYAHLEGSSLLLFCYLEIEKPWGNKIASEQIRLLQQKLPGELKQCIQSLTPSLLIPHNQEEVYKNIVQLAKELHSAKDLPQVIITQQAQSRDLSCFQIIAVRIKKKSPLRFDHLPSSIRLNSQKVVPLKSSSNLQKEALILQLEVDNSLFLRRNWTIDQREARNCIVKTLEHLLGSFRDYTGGLFLQQERQFEQISRNLKRKDECPIEELFYGFNPSAFQTLIPTRTAAKLFSFFAEILKKELPLEGFLITKKKYREDTLLILKTNALKTCTQFLNCIKNQLEQDEASFGYSIVEQSGMHYFCLVDLNSFHLNALEQIEEEFKEEKCSDEPYQSKVLRINFQEGDPPSLNPRLAADIRSRTLGKALFEGLTRLNPKGVPELAAAREVKTSPCQTIYTFLLREHHWSNGEPVTAYDFEHAWKKSLFSGFDSLYADLFYIIKNAKAVTQGGSIKDVKIRALNAKTFQVELEQPASHFLHLIAHPAFSPLYKGEEEPIHFNGPFIVKKWQRDHFLQLTVNPYYWDRKNVSLQEIFITMVKDICVVSEMFKRKELDWIGDPFSLLPQQDILNISLQTRRVDRIYWICLNTLSFPLHSAKIRRALALVINRKQITHDLFNGSLPLLSPMPNTRSKKTLVLDGNILLAQQLFKEGLQELGLTHKTFPKITFNYSDIPGQALLAQTIKNQIESALEITLDLVEIHWNAFLNLIDKRDYQIVGYFKSVPYFYPSSSYLELFQERFNPVNASQWENSECFSLLGRAQKTRDPKMRSRLLKKAEEILLEEMPVICLFQQVYKYLIHPRIKKITLYRNGDVDLKCAFFK